MRQVAILGVGMTKFGISDKTAVELFSEAAMDAISESNLRPEDIQALCLGNVLGDCAEGQLTIASAVAADLGLLNVPTTRFEAACASATVAIRDAFIWVASGFYDVVLAGGTERLSTMGTHFATRTFAMGSDSRFETPAGITFPGVFGMIAHLYAKKYGIPLAKLKEQMALVAIKNHGNADLNPKAHFGSIKGIMNSRIAKARERGQPVPKWQDEMEFLGDPKTNPMIADPLQLFDCCPFSDGAAAVVLTTIDTAKKLADKPVLIAGVGQASAGNLLDQRDITRIRAREISVKQAYDMAGLGPEDVDVCELHDCFTIAEIVASENLGFFAFGEGSKAVEKGETRLGGNIPINPSGGLKGKGHPIGATGCAQVYEVVKQLRGECGERQVEGAKVGLIDTLGGDLWVVVNIVLKRGW